MRLLWLDDIRNPFSTEVDWLSCSPIGRDVDVVWVKSYFEFIDWINKNGLPDGISFDHDLGKLTETELLRQGFSKQEARRSKGQEKSGYDCAKWLVEYCMDKNVDIPIFNVHSSNPAGSENIKGILENYKNFRQKN